MKLKIKRHIEQEQTIDINFPYYYKIIREGDKCIYTVYGKLEINKHLSIIRTECEDDEMDSYECEFRQEKAEDAWVFENVELISEEEFREVRNEFINKICWV